MRCGKMSAEKCAMRQIGSHSSYSTRTPICSNRCGPCLSKSAVRKQVTRVRIKHQIPVVEARQVEDVDIPAASQIYITVPASRTVFMGDSGADGEDSERVLLFGRERNINWSAECRSSTWTELSL
uniref:Uncharacterized protein n=1 Tax=Ditylenchus dipsaci TaxID=166011 RepID=A0A915CSQ6_9BILA